MRTAARSLASVVLPVLLALGSAACEDREPPTSGPARGSAGAAGAGGTSAGGEAGASANAGAAGQVSLDLEGGTLLLEADRLVLRNGTAVVATLPAKDFKLGTVAALSATHSYDPFQPFAKSALFREPDDFAEVRGASFEDLRAIAGGLSASLVYEDGTRAPLTLTKRGAGAVEASLALPVAAKEKPIVHAGLDVRGSATEGFYGLGEQFDDVDQRGKVRAMQLEIDSSIESSYNEAHVPVPFVIGTSGWALFVQSRRLGVFSLGTVDADRVTTNWSRAYAPASEPFVFHLFVADHPLDLVKPYYAATGAPRLPAPWGLGPWIWRDESKDQAEVESDLATIRKLDLATTGYWIDRPYASAVNSFDFEPKRFPDAQKIFADADALGFRTALWHTPYLDEKEPATAELLAEAEASGFYPPTTGPSLNKWGRPLDLTNEAARAFWQKQLGNYTAMGVRGFKLDYGEDIVAGLGTGRLPWAFADGSDERTAQQTYTLAYHRTYAELFPAGESFLICRAGKWGDQTNVDVIWPGDLDATFALHREPALDGEGKTYNSVGGLPASVVAGLSLGASGFPFYGADTGGYRHSPPDKELFVRWFEQTALSTVMQVGTSSNTVPWETAGGPGFDEELLVLYRRYARLHLRLFPYLWSLAQRLAVDGRPLARPFGLAYPELGVHPNDQYLLGDALLVAPVLARGVTTRAVIFPASKWTDFWTGEVLEGGQSHDVAAPLGTLPLYLAPGAIVPLLRSTIDTLSPTTKPAEVDSFATTPGPLVVRLTPGLSSSFTLYDGGRFDQVTDPEGTRVTFTPGSIFDGAIVYEIAGLGDRRAGVTIDGVGATAQPSVIEADALGGGGQTAFDADGGVLRVAVGAGSHQVIVATP